MPKVIYNGNGSGGGTVPVDSTNYAVGSKVNVAGNTGNLTRTGAVFLYWNTAANGSGTIYGAGGNFNFPNQPGDLTLYAQWGVTTGLTGGGVTTHLLLLRREPGGSGRRRARQDQLGDRTARETRFEDDFNWMQTQFAGVNITKGSASDPATSPPSRRLDASWWPLS